MTISERLKTLQERNEWEDLVHDLTRIGINLSAEKNIDKLLQLILTESMRITKSDAGSLYIKEEEEPNEILRFKYTKCLSKEFPFTEFVLPINKKSIAGACASMGKTFNFSDMSETIDVLEIEHNKTFDNSIGYSTRNMLVIPMRNYSGSIIGVMQLINKKRSTEEILLNSEDFDRHVIPYTTDDEELIESLSSQAAILMERSLLLQEIETQFESFIECLVTALDQRDPVTAGHSKRVADYAVQLAKDITESQAPSFNAMNFDATELKSIYYAGLLHDVGKIGVRERVLTKKKRLSQAELKNIQYKFFLYRNQLEEKEMQQSLSSDESGILSTLDNDFKTLVEVNDAYFLKDHFAACLKKLETYRFMDIDGEEKALLTPHELKHLGIKKGNLTEEERRMIESHPEHTFNILSDIAWSKPLRNVPVIAAEHHEKLDGSGYPKGLSAQRLSLKSRILGVVDIFDALTAKDRPYKHALSLEKTLSILKEEADAKRLDPDLINLFIQAKTYQVYLDGDAND